MHNFRFNFTRIFTSIAIASIAIFIFLQILIPVQAVAGINRQINFQGKLVNNPASTNVSDTSYTVIFTLYNNPNAGQGTPLWTETQTVTTVDGIFRVALGSVTPFPANFNFNWDGLYLGIKVNSDAEMTPRVQMAAVPFAFNAQQVAGLTVQDTSGNASTSGTLQIANAKTVAFGGAFSTTAGNDVAFTTTGSTALTLPTSGTLISNSYTSTQTSGNLLSLTDSTAQAGALTGLNLTLGSTNSQTQYGIQFNLSGTGTAYDLYGTGGSWSITKGGALSVASCTGCGAGGGGTNWWNLVSGIGVSNGGYISPVNSTADLLIGSQATSSALFAFTGLSSLAHQTQASTSGQFIVMPNNGYGGRVGIGTTNPRDNLTLGSGISESSMGLMSAANNGLFFSTWQNTAYLSINRRSSDGTFVNSSYGAASIGFASTTSGGYFDFNTSASVNTNPAFAMRINTDGRVGIGIDTPTALLDVSGAASVGGQLKFRSGIAQIQSTVNQGLTIGGDTTGQITLSALNGTQNIKFAGYTTAGCTLKTDTSGLVTCGTDLTGGGGGGASYIDQSNGLTYVGNTTTDFAIGGTSTGSAKFVFGVGTNGSAPMATFSGALMMEAQANSSVSDQTNWQQISGTVGTLGGGTGSVASISAMASFNGSLYVGTTNIVNGAEVYRYNGATSWTKVSNATAGSIDGTTTGIASISAMTVFNGNLYIGTSKMNSAEIYRYNGATSWTKVSGPAAGTFGAITAVDGVSSLAVYQGQIYAGLREPGAARLMSWGGGLTWVAVNTTAGTFVATNTIGMHSVGPMVVKNGFLYFAAQKGTDTDILRYSGGNGATNAYFMSMNLASTTGSYSINGTATVGVSEVTAMTVYNGAVIVAIARGNGQADVLQLNDGMPTGTTSPNSWTRLNNAVGQMTYLGTSAIDSITALTVYNGLLYAGTNESGNAEIYRYTGGDQKWFEVSQTTSGQIAIGGTTGIYGVTYLMPINGDLYAGTNLGLRAEVYKLSNVNINKSYSIVFHASPSMAGGEQSGIDSTASIFFLASASANLGNTAGNTGAFIFDHGIQTRNGSYDVAEDYPTRDNTLKPGDVVAIDPNERGFVKKTSGAYDHDVLGVFSSNPALRLSQADAFIDGGYVIPVALAGRVPVKVSTESGEIKPGDYLTPSSVPGVAMKAVKSSVVFAQAMEGYTGDGVGEVLSYIKSMTYQGALADKFTNLNSNSSDFAVNVLDQFKTQGQSDGKSNIITDRLIAGLEVIAPKISAEKVNLDEINVLSGTDISLNLSSDGKFIIKNSSGSAGITFDANGNAYFSGLVFADKIKANQIEGLEIFTNRLSSLDKSIASVSSNLNAAVLGVSTESASFSPSSLTLSSLNIEGLATVSADLAVKGSGFFQGALNVLESITTQNLLVSQFAYFINDVVFKGNVRFNQAPTFSKDTAGFAVIKKDSDSVQVIFDQEYNQVPVVTASISMDKTEDSIAQKQLEDAVLNGNFSYIITQRTTKGFVIRLNKSASQDFNFSWVALSVKDVKTSGITPTPSSSFPVIPSAGAQSILNQLDSSPSGRGGGG